MRNDLVGLIDADFLKYLVVYDIEQMYKRGLSDSITIPYNTIVALIEKRIQKIFEQTADFSKNYYFLFSGKTKDNHRWLISTVKPYKGNRVYKTKIPGEVECRNTVEEYIKETYNYCKYADLEADDLCTMGHTKDTYIYSNDKDLRASPGVHYDIKSGKVVIITATEGFKLLLVQSMTGDTVDNIAGIAGVGKVGAGKIAKGKENRALLDAVITEFTEKDLKLGLDRFVEMYSLVALRTGSGEWERKKYEKFFTTLDKLVNEKDEDLIF